MKTNSQDKAALFDQIEREIELYGIDSHKWYCHTDPGHSGNGFRLDEGFVNGRLIKRLAEARHVWGELDGNSRRDALSDHAALILDFTD
ncbi:MAG: hypothetical protein IIC27_05585 [Chloroflexi bacterium]|nr:hypothetical protein [Chloroflexota bacterium]